MTGCVAEGGLGTARHVLIACGIPIERKGATACIEISDCVPEERIIVGRRIAEANCEANERTVAYTCVAIAHISNGT